MKTSQLVLLLIGDSEDLRGSFAEMLGLMEHRVIYADTIEKAIEKSLNDFPDLIICFFEMRDLNGFQVYNILNNELLKNEVPFIMVFNQFQKNDFLIAVELGVDGFIYPPFEQDKVMNIIEKRILIVKERKAASVVKFNSLCNLIPYGVFVAEGRKIIQTNRVFNSLVEGIVKTDDYYMFHDVFMFETENDGELNFSRFVNGITKDCRLRNVHIRGRNRESFNLYFSLVKQRGSSSKVVGVVVPVGYEGELIGSRSLFKQHGKSGSLTPGMLTPREWEVLQLSATGIPIKQIAEKLSISERTVEKHRSNIIQKTNSENIMEVVFMYGKNVMYQ
jgi:DNA-binding NarL/FixJ family response regulator